MTLFSLFESLRALLEMHLLLAAAYGFFLAAWKLARPVHARAWVRVGQALIVICLFLPIAVRTLPRTALFKPTAHLIAGGTRGGGAPFPLLAPVGRTALAAAPDAVAVSERLLSGLLCLLALGVVASLGRLVVRRHRLAGFLRAQVPWKRVGRARVLLAEGGVIPFSARYRHKAYVVLPAELMSDPRWRLAFRHEAIHHRRGDTLWVYFIEIVRAALWGNPAVGAFARLIDQLQELACDETVLARRGLCAHAYGDCLFEVARRAQAAPVYAPGLAHRLAAPAAPFFLRERIERLFTIAPAKPSRALAVVTPVALLALAAIALSLRSTVQDRRLTLAEAKALVASGRHGIPLDVNEPVLARLNAFIGTPEGRARVKAGLRRLPRYRDLFAAKFAAYGAPEELAGVALFESNLNRLAVSPGAGAAGIWQFMAQTARRYGLTVGGKRDDRLHPERSTDAALRYLGDLHRQFGDWRLALKAYNEGEFEVERLIRVHGTRDPWVLDRASSPENYLSGAIAMMIVLRHPQLLD